MKKFAICLAFILSCALSSVAQENKYKIVFLSDGTVKIGPIGSLKEYHQGESFTMGVEDYIFFTKPGAYVKIANVSTRKFYEISDADYSSTNMKFNEFLQSKSLATKGVAGRQTVHLIDTLFISGLEKGAKMIVDGQNPVELPYHESYDSYITSEMLPNGADTVRVTLYNRDSSLFAESFIIKILRK